MKAPGYDILELLLVGWMSSSLVGGRQAQVRGGRDLRALGLSGLDQSMRGGLEMRSGVDRRGQLAVVKQRRSDRLATSEAIWADSAGRRTVCGLDGGT